MFELSIDSAVGRLMLSRPEARNAIPVPAWADLADRAEEAERQQRILQESEHRVKNMLTVVQAIALQTAANSADMESFTASFSGRLESLARAHQLLVVDEEDPDGRGRVLGHDGILTGPGRAAGWQ